MCYHDGELTLHNMTVQIKIIKKEQENSAEKYSHKRAENIYRRYVECGLSQPIPFLGVGQQYIKFAKEKPEI